jgi:hypothetical protein
MRIAEKEVVSLIEKAAEVNNITTVKVLSKSRVRAYVEARQMVYFLLRNSGWGWTEVASRFDRTHASIINGYKAHENDYQTMHYYRSNFDKMRILCAENPSSEIDQAIKLVDEIERLVNENSRLKDKLYDVKANTLKLTKSLTKLCN